MYQCQWQLWLLQSFTTLDEFVKYFYFIKKYLAFHKYASYGDVNNSPDL